MSTSLRRPTVDVSETMRVSHLSSFLTVTHVI